MVKHLFLQNLPISILKNVFSCWKGLIDVYLLPNKNCGYVKYADRDSAEKAIQILNGAEICGSKLKVHITIVNLKRIWFFNFQYILGNGSRRKR